MTFLFTLRHRLLPIGSYNFCYAFAAHPSAEQNRFVPWRSAWLGWTIAFALLVLGVPLFVRMPPWCDVTLYDLAARAVMRGGLHYRDVFDTNLPGFVWALISVRRLLGPSMEVLRIVDLLIVSLCSILLLRLARLAGASRSGIAWSAAGIAAYYPFTSEFCHAQRDVWMLLPALLAVSLRLRHIDRGATVTPRALFLMSFVEGFAWGMAVWIKPHMIVIATVVWRVSCQWRQMDRSIRIDLAGNILGGAFVGLLGFAWLYLTGTLPYFIEVMTTWNTKYLATVIGDLPDNCDAFFSVFPGWSLLHLLAIPLALFTLFDQSGKVARFSSTTRLTTWSRTWLYVPAADVQTRRIRVVLAALYLAWTLQAFSLQRNFEYVHVPEIFLLLTILAMHRWSVAFTMILWLTFTSFAFVTANHSSSVRDILAMIGSLWPDYGNVAPLHPLGNPQRNAEWSNCWQGHVAPCEYRRRADAVAINWGGFPTIEMTGIGEVSDYLRSLGVRDGDVLCWHDSPHAAYLDLGIEPRFRFMHVTTPVLMGDGPYFRMMNELKMNALPEAKYLITDLKRLSFRQNAPPRIRLLEPGPDLLPPILTPQLRAVFPYNQPAVFRSGGGSGRYVVHKLTKPVTQTEFEIEAWGPVAK